MVTRLVGGRFNLGAALHQITQNILSLCGMCLVTRLDVPVDPVLLFTKTALCVTFESIRCCPALQSGLGSQ